LTPSAAPLRLYLERAFSLHDFVLQKPLEANWRRVLIGRFCRIAMSVIHPQAAAPLQISRAFSAVFPSCDI
jgi:hypothetical protein